MKDDSLPNTAIVTVEAEDHTLGNLLRSYAAVVVAPRSRDGARTFAHPGTAPVLRNQPSRAPTRTHRDPTCWHCRTGPAGSS